MGEAVYANGIETCGYVFGCAVCGHKIRIRRAFEVMSAANEWTARGGTFGMLTLTVRHRLGMSLLDVQGALTDSWRLLQQRSEYRELRALVFGTIKALEVKVGDNGWHPHLHLLLFVKPGSDVQHVAKLAVALDDPWAELVAARLGIAPSREHGIDYRALRSDAAPYISKIGFETASSDTKKLGGRDPLELLEDARNGELRAWSLVNEFLDTMRRRHSLDWSKGLRKELGLMKDKTDEELAREDVGGELVALIERAVWMYALRHRDQDGVPLVWQLMNEAKDAWQRERANGRCD